MIWQPFILLLAHILMQFYHYEQLNIKKMVRNHNKLLHVISNFKIYLYKKIIKNYNRKYTLYFLSNIKVSFIVYYSYYSIKN